MKKLSNACISVVMTLILLLGTCSFTFAASNAKSTYIQLESNTLKSIEKLISQNQLISTDNLNTTKTELEIYGENLPFDFSNVKLKAYEENDIKNAYTYEKVTLGSKTEDMLSCELLLKDNKIMLQIPEIYNKHIVLDLTKLKDILSKFNIDMTEEEFEQFNKLLEKTKNGTTILSKEDEAYLKKVAPQFIKKLNKLIDTKYFSLNNNAKLTYNDTTVNCKSVSFEINYYELANILNELLQDAKKDENLLNIIVKILEYSSTESITRQDILTFIDNFEKEYKNIQSELQQIKLTSTLFYNNNKQVLKREISLTINESEEDYSISLITINNNKSAYYELNFNNTIKITDTVSKNGNKSEHNIQVTEETFDYDFDYETYELIETPYTETTNLKILVEKTNDSIVFTLSVEDEPTQYILEVKTKKINKNKATANLIFTVDTKTIDYKVFVDYSMEVNAKITQKTFNSKEISLANMSKEALINEYENNLESIQQKSINIFSKLFPTITMLLQQY